MKRKFKEKQKTHRIEEEIEEVHRDNKANLKKRLSQEKENIDKALNHD